MNNTFKITGIMLKNFGNVFCQQARQFISKPR